MFLDQHARRCSLHWPTFLLIGSNIRPRLKNDGYRIAARCNWLPTEHLKRQNRKVYNLTIIFITKLISIISKCQFQLVWLFKPEEWSILRTNDDKIEYNWWQRWAGFWQSAKVGIVRKDGLHFVWRPDTSLRQNIHNWPTYILQPC